MRNAFGDVRDWLTVLVVIAAVTGVVQAENWSGWRGPSRNGVSADTGVPVKWSAESNVAWKTPLPGSGISNPIIFDDRVVSQETLHRTMRTLTKRRAMKPLLLTMPP